jgi:predicted ATPase
LGFPDQARQSCTAAIQYASELNQVNLTTHVRVFAGAGLYELLRDVPAVREHADRIVSLSHEHSLGYWLVNGLILQGWVLAQEERGDEGINLMRQNVTERASLHVGWYQIRYLCMLAETHLQLSQTEAGMQVIAEAMVLMERNEDRMWEAELTRIKGELLLAQRTPSTDVEASFQHALTIACQQNARSFELRAATSLARLWLDNGKHRQAYDLLFPIYHWFTEGFDTPDLKDAKALLDDLS